MKQSLLAICMVAFCFISKAQEKKQLHIQRTDNAPKIDGILDDSVWSTAEKAQDFIQFRPTPGVKDSEENKTVVQMTYDDTALYIAAYLYDDPSKIAKQLSSRDNFGNADFFGIILNPNNDAQNDTEFFLFASGTQADAIANPTVGEDFGWNSVWDSAVSINEDGWSLEMKIPYRCLRFDNTNLETWGVQFHRRFRRDESQYVWNEIDISKGLIGQYHGELKGLTNLEPPTRLAFYPFVSTVQNNFEGVYESNFNAGLDVKFGITENFTLDATLIPDFSQAGFDNVSLNLGPFEQTFSERRQFFTEGVDLFNKANLFFSRRVGSAPITDPVTSANEEVVDFPESVKVLNAIKVSGRTQNGLGLGFFNSFTEKAEAIIEQIDTGERRREVVEPFTNYNIVVVDQQFNGNSSIGLINTNVTREGHFRDANVTALSANIMNKRNTYAIRSDVKMSNLNLMTGNETGFSTFFAARKAHGNFRYSFDHSYADTEFDPNDLGLQFRNNYNNFGIDINYRTFEPSGKWNRYFANFYVNYTRLADPSTFTGFGLGVSANGQTTKLSNMGFNLNLNPGRQFDYFEPRRAGSFFITENRANINGWWNSNDNKKLALSANAGVETLFEEGRDYVNYWLGFGPRYRFNDKFIVSYFVYREYYTGDRGYVTQVEDDVIFGDRHREEIEQTMSASYNFNPRNTLSLTLRNYWAVVEYDRQLFSLQENGRVTNTTGYTTSNIGYDPNVNFTTWNFDLSYSWQFAPGSFLTALYRNQLFNFDSAARDSYAESLGTLFDQPINHTLSVKLQYFLDYNQIPALLQGNKKGKNKV
ncbi:DUF5916 domain-containing protein [Jejudonia soesokkakensis]|uniref:DUF5916 domain-containing protein n=1 Tax=Jejudonia soesokkakensis TaxID=1323432 RepID=A0ABW2MQP1_9FLAO